MPRRRKEVGIRRKRGGWQAFVVVDGKYVSRQFPLDTPVAEMRAWRDAQVDTAFIPPATGTFAADVERYLAKPEIQAMPSYPQRAAHLDLWLTRLGRDRALASITRDEVETVLQEWLAAGLSPVTVYHRRTALGSCCTLLGGSNPVTGTTRPAHYRPVDRSVAIDTIERILAEMPAEKFLAKGIKAPSLARLRAAVIAYTGIPPAELQKLRAHHFDREAAILHMPWREKGAGTPAHIRELTPDGVAALIALDAAHGWGPFAAERLAASFKRAARRVCGPETRIRLYDLRHSFGADLYRTTHDLATVGRMLGHVPGSIVTHRYAMGAHADVDRAAAIALQAARDAKRQTTVPPARAPRPVTARRVSKTVRTFRLNLPEKLAR